MKRDWRQMWDRTREFFGRNRFLIIAAMAFIFIVIVIFVLAQKTSPKATLSVTVAPSIATVKVGEWEYASVGTYEITPGEYDVEIFAEGFLTKYGHLVAVADETVSVTLYLEPTAENSRWYDDHPEEGLILGDIKSQMALMKREELKTVYPILNYVPYIKYTYGIEYETECQENGNGVCLIIDAKQGLRDTAIRYLQGTGEKLSDYVVKVKNYAIPFNEIVIEVPKDLQYDAGVENDSLTNELNYVLTMVRKYLDENMMETGYTSEVLQVKRYGEYCGVKVKVYMGDEQDNYDTLRMLVGKVNGVWTILAAPDWILSQYRNPDIPVGLLDAVNEL